MFAGVLVQHFVLYGVAARLIRVAKTPRMTATSSENSGLLERVALARTPHEGEHTSGHREPSHIHFCPVCGAEVTENAQRCLRCMARLGGQSTLEPVESNASGTPSVQRSPTSGVIAVVCLLAGVLGAFNLKGGLGALIVAAFLIGAGSCLGLIAGVVAIVRNERWMTMNLIVLLINVLITLKILSLFLH